MTRPTAFTNAHQGGIARDLAAARADAETWKRRAIAAEAATNVSAAGRLLRSVQGRPDVAGQGELLDG